MKKEDKIIRVGDTVMVKDHSKYIKRIGYNLVWNDDALLEEVEDDPRTAEAARILGWKPGENFSHEFIKAIAMRRVKERGFGGNERSIHYIDESEDALYYKYLGAGIMYPKKVVGKRVAKTGTYFPPTNGGYDHDGYYDGDPGGLSDMKTHIILTLDNYQQIEAIHVTKLKNAD